jgi:hypothetical protein
MKEIMMKIIIVIIIIIIIIIITTTTTTTIIIITTTTTTTTTHVEYASKCDTSNNRGDWDHFKITQMVPEQHTGKA